MMKRNKVNAKRSVILTLLIIIYIVVILFFIATIYYSHITMLVVPLYYLICLCTILIIFTNDQIKVQIIKILRKRDWLFKLVYFIITCIILVYSYNLIIRIIAIIMAIFWYGYMRVIIEKTE